MRTPRYPRTPIAKIGSRFVEEWVGECVPTTGLQITELLQSTPEHVWYLAHEDSGDAYGVCFVRRVPGAMSAWESRAERLEALDGRRLVQMSHRINIPDWIVTLYRWGGGLQLSRLVEKKGALGYDTVVQLTGEICLALIELHGTGFAHGALDPEHVLAWSASEELMAKLIAFDLYGEQAPDPGAEVKPGRFWAPELVRGEAPTPRTDLYQLGATMFFALTGRAPFVEENQWALASSQLRGAPRVFEIAPGLRGTMLDQLVADLLAVDPGERPASPLTVLGTL